MVAIRRKRANTRLVRLWRACAKHAVIMRILSYGLPQQAIHFSDRTTLVCSAWRTPEPRRVASVTRKLATTSMNNVPWGEYACEGLDHRVGHPSCLSAGQKHLSTRRKGHSRTPTSCGMAKSHPPRDRSRTLLIIRLFFKINKDL